ncbi:hypothetical protein NSK_008296 [Nannochloropsis salina CCMP1776]|uniref:Protein kinase domain-containing protein n=1 Tax=Nannochloropsis salina CCMP1776 TaxID=1027361 RepID=A0A4D9CUR5_9STRA|nr:hypothetical protein NSK_008296 [Nannochloropsis salina CCMP1776]|eukprot:TFJ80389.1 hypothetical protein NSK_008296 [Nannochloropsis salina CCMP1776]
MLVFNPDKRVTVDEALQHPHLAKIRDPRLEISMATPLRDGITTGWGIAELKSALYSEVCDVIEAGREGGREDRH